MMSNPANAGRPVGEDVMPHELQLTIEHTSEISALELQNEINMRIGKQINHGALSVRKEEPRLPPGTAGDPGLVNLVITYAPNLIPTLSVAIATWITAGRKRKTTRARRIAVSAGGDLEITEIEVDELERSDSTDSMVSALSHILKSPDAGAPRG